MNTNSQSGFSMIELVVTVLAASIIAICLVSLLGVNGASIRDNADAKELETTADDALAALSAAADTIPDGGTFSVSSSGEFSGMTSGCSVSFCDYVTFPEAPLEARTSVAKGVPTLSSGQEAIYERRWRIDTINADYRLRRIVVAVFKYNGGNTPLFVQQTTVGAGL